MKVIKRHRLISALISAALLISLFSPAGAQQQTKIPRVGYFTVRSKSTAPLRDEAFRRGLRELGYFEGKNIHIEWRFADGKLDRLPALAAELMRLNLDVVVSTGPTNTRVLKDATNTLPIVMAQDSDPIGNGFVATLARPGGNITGLSTHYPEIGGGNNWSFFKKLFHEFLESRFLVIQPNQVPLKHSQKWNRQQLIQSAVPIS